MRLLLLLGALGALVAACSKPEPPVLPAVYCYHTLGRADCYDVPQESEVRRMVGYDGPPPIVRGSAGQ